MLSSAVHAVDEGRVSDAQRIIQEAEPSILEGLVTSPAVSYERNGDIVAEVEGPEAERLQFEVRLVETADVISEDRSDGLQFRKLGRVDQCIS